MELVGTIDRISATAPREQIDQYIYSGHPVILEGVGGEWPALRKWTPAFFESSLGSLPVKYRVSSCNAHPDLSSDSGMPPMTGTMSSFLKLIGPEQSPSERVRYYLTGDGKTMSLISNRSVNPALSLLLDDIQFPKMISREDVRTVGLWLSAAEARSWLHYDSQGLHNLNVQVTGRKELLLFSPDELSHLYPHTLNSLKEHNFSQVDLDRPDYQAFPNFREARAIEGLLTPGDCLFLPAFWFHSFKGKDDFNSNINFWWKGTQVASSVTAYRSAFLHTLVRTLRVINDGAPGGGSDNEAKMSPELDQFIALFHEQLCAERIVGYF